MALELSTSPAIRTYTLEEFFQLPEPTNGTRYELIASVLYMSPAPDWFHNELQSRLLEILFAFKAESGLPGRIYTGQSAIYHGESYLVPDAFYLRNPPQGTDPDTSDWVLEILSPSTRLYDLFTKADTYAALGVNEIWIVDPESKTVEVRNLENGRYRKSHTFAGEEIIQSLIFPSLQLRPGALFDEGSA